jgi:DNA invertase Pin-like site-specific DNA recombinase
MTNRRPVKITLQQLLRKALVYLRKSTLRPVEETAARAAFQHEQKALALRLGWPEKVIEVIDEDVGMSGLDADSHEGVKRLRKLVAQEVVGIIVASGACRFTRSRSDLESLLGLCRNTNTLLAIDGTVVDPDDPGECPLG